MLPIQHLNWQKLWPECVPERDFEGFQFEAGPSIAAVTPIISEQDDAVVDDILSMGKSMVLWSTRRTSINLWKATLPS